MDAKNAEIAAFFISGTVPCHLAGVVMKALYEANATDMVIDPVYDRIEAKGAPKKALAAPKNSFKHDSQIGTLYRLIVEAGGPIDRATLVSALDDAGHIGKHISTPLKTLVNRGKIKKTAHATYQAT